MSCLWRDGDGVRAECIGHRLAAGHPVRRAKPGIWCKLSLNESFLLVMRDFPAGRIRNRKRPHTEATTVKRIVSFITHLAGLFGDLWPGAKKAKTTWTGEQILQPSSNQDRRKQSRPHFDQMNARYQASSSATVFLVFDFLVQPGAGIRPPAFGCRR